MSRRSLIIVLALGALVVAGGFVGVVLATSGGDDKLTIYTARSHYGEEAPFKTFAADEDVNLTLFGGSASELYERLKSEGSNTKADALITVDAANLYRAEEAGLLAENRDPEVEKHVPPNLRDPKGRWYGLTVRARTIMRSKDRVKPDAVTTYAGLGDPRWKGRLCLRSGTSEYNISFVADRIAKDGAASTKAMLQRWMDNEPTILGSDTDVLKSISGGACDVGLTNSYYLGRELEEDEDFPVVPVWADQKGRGTHLNLSGIGVVKGADQAAEAKALVRYLTEPKEQRVFAQNNHEFGVDSQSDTTPEIKQFGSFKKDPIDVAGAGKHLDDAVKMMNSVGWN
ncbi:MAG TPA: extracellular solute-binding protein [Thermoleophilaceae bacterium]|nr:extracellular solute-binding protein [Thermoleophilaceae bacterium]